jgi:dTDP-4-dehydrorhamnose reductase
MVKLLLLGATGQVGWELQRSLAPLGTLVSLGRSEADLNDHDRLRYLVRLHQPTVLVNAAAYTAVDRAEGDAHLATRINADAPEVLAQEARRLGALLVHFSTDYVFDGNGITPWRESDTPNPINTYGETKLAGERRIRDSGAEHLIVRTSWVYAARGGNFLRTMVRLIQEREELNVIDDQVGAPTGAELIADVTAHLLARSLCDPSVRGTYHLAAAGETSWHAYACFILETARALQPTLQPKARAITAIPTSAYTTPAPRPLNSRLDTHHLRHTLGLHLPDWRTGVRRTLEEVL